MSWITRGSKSGGLLGHQHLQVNVHVEGILVEDLLVLLDFVLGTSDLGVDMGQEYLVVSCRLFADKIEDKLGDGS
ncbi:MAG: hypothetical protein ACFCD0_00100 [Gemmataceae bacterium]